MEKKRFVLETQMRAGTHYMCHALLNAYHPYMHYPLRNGGTRQLEHAEIERGLKEEARIDNIEINYGIEILFRHYYHKLELDPAFSGEKKIALIGFPLDSFYSDGIVFSSEHYTPSPSLGRETARGYVMGQGSKEWDFLYPYMIDNARWLETLSRQGNGENLLIVRYEDLIDNFIVEKRRVIDFMQLDLVGELPEPRKNRNRMYWNNNYAERFDAEALRTLFQLFRRSIEAFYPEHYENLDQMLIDSGAR